MTEAPQTAASPTKYLTWVWAQQSSWSQRGDQLRTQLDRARLGSLILTVGAAGAVTAAAQIAQHSVGVSRMLAIVGAILGALVPVVRRASGTDTVEAWTRTRSVSEGLKRITYTYLAGVAPYRGVGRHSRFQADIDDLLAKTDKELGAAVAAITPKQRAVPAVNDIDEYVTERVLKQITGYYTPKSVEMGVTATTYRLIEYALVGLGIVLSAVAAVYPTRWPAAWVAVITTAGAAFAAQAAVQRYGALRLEFAYAAGQLARLQLDRPDPADDGYRPSTLEMDDAFVRECELVISNQHEDWMAGSIKAAQANAEQAHQKAAAA